MKTVLFFRSETSTNPKQVQVVLMVSNDCLPDVASTQIWSVQRSASASSWAHDWIWEGGSGPSVRLFWSVYGQKIFDQYASKCLEWLTQEEGWLVLPKFEC